MENKKELYRLRLKSRKSLGVIAFLLKRVTVINPDLKIIYEVFNIYFNLTNLNLY